MNESTKIIACQDCGAKNRVALDTSRQAVCGKCKKPLVIFVKPNVITDSNFSQEVSQSALPVLVDFWATWCAPCKMIAPIIDELARELAGKVKIGKLDVDKNPEISARFRVQSIPTLIIFKDGKVADRLVGAQSKEAILRHLELILK